MYEHFYGLSGKPFSLLPDANFLYFSQRHRRVLNLLDYAVVTQAGFVAVTGDVGAGKTTLIRRFLRNAGPDLTLGVITNTNRAFGTLLGWIVQAFDFKSGEQDPIKLYNGFVDFLVSQYAKGKRCVLIIDEAQNLDAAMLEELRMLSNVNNERDQLLQIILVGQPELLEMLKRHELRQFAQRISVHCHLGPLMPKETAGYIRHRLAVVGGAPTLFDDTACAAVHYFTGGVPRLINLLCDQAMVYSFSEDERLVSFKTVAEVVRDRKQGGLSAFREVLEGVTEERLLGALFGILAEIRQTSGVAAA